MAVDRSYVGRNDRERARLRALIQRSSDADLAREMPAGWTVASVLLHCAFWDQRILVLVERWQRHGTMPRPELDDEVEWINDSMRPMLLAIPPRDAARLALDIAEHVDGMVAALSDEWVRRIVGQNTITLVRAAHRGEHLDELERVLDTGAR